MNGPDQERVAKAYIAQLEAAQCIQPADRDAYRSGGTVLSGPRRIIRLSRPAPDAPYIAINDLPKVQALQTLFPDNWHSSAIKVGKLASGD